MQQGGWRTNQEPPSAEPQLTDGVDSGSLGLPESQKVTPRGNLRKHLGHRSFETGECEAERRQMPCPKLQLVKGQSQAYTPRQSTLSPVPFPLQLHRILHARLESKDWGSTTSLLEGPCKVPSPLYTIHPHPSNGCTLPSARDDVFS